MFWIKKNTVERKLADAMSYEYCTLFDTGRSALRTLVTDPAWPPPIPSNVCPVLQTTVGFRAPLCPIDRLTGLAGIGVSLYGYRDFYGWLDIDPLMTGFLRPSQARAAVISFGRKKMLDIGAGGALLSNQKYEGHVRDRFPELYRNKLEDCLSYFPHQIPHRWERIEMWDRYLGDSCVRIPQEQIMPWRVIRRIPGKRDAVVKALREAGYAVGTNYSPLPGVTDAGAIQWGQEVINFFPEEPDIPGACEIIKRTIG